MSAAGICTTVLAGTVIVIPLIVIVPPANGPEPATVVLLASPVMSKEEFGSVCAWARAFTTNASKVRSTIPPTANHSSR